MDEIEESFLLLIAKGQDIEIMSETQFFSSSGLKFKMKSQSFGIL